MEKAKKMADDTQNRENTERRGGPDARPNHEVVDNEPQKEVTVHEPEKEVTVHEPQKETVVNEPNHSTETLVNEAPSQTPSQTPEAHTGDNEDTNEGEISRRIDDPGELNPEKKKNGPFKTGDIIEYMFNDWLIGGMNWLWIEAVYAHDKKYYRRKYEKECKAASSPKMKKLKNYDTYKKMQSLDEKAVKNIEAADNKFSNNTGLIDLAARLREGDFEGLSDETAFILKNMSRKNFDKLLDPQRIKETQERLNNNMIAASQFSNIYAYVALMDAKMKDASSPTDQAAWDRAQKEGLVTYLRLIDYAKRNGQDVQTYSKDLLHTISDAGDNVRDNVKKGRFDGFSKKNIFGRIKKGAYEPNEAFQSILNQVQNVNLEGTPQNLYEEVVMQQNFDKTAQEKMLQHNMTGSLLADERERLIARHKALERAKENINKDPARKEARERLEQIRAQKRQQRLQNLKNPDYVMKDEKGKDNPALTAAMRKYYQDRFLMK